MSTNEFVAIVVYLCLCFPGRLECIVVWVKRILSEKINTIDFIAQVHRSKKLKISLNVVKEAKYGNMSQSRMKKAKMYEC